MSTKVLIATGYESCFNLKEEVKTILKERHGWTDDALEACEQGLDGLRHHPDLHAVYDEFEQDILGLYCAADRVDVKGDSYAIVYDNQEHVIVPSDLTFVSVTKQVDVKNYVWE